MALPSNKHSIHETTLPISKRKVKYRPFLVGEEKVLMMASESKKSEDMILALKQIAENCAHGLDVSDLPLVDLEYLFIKIRIASKGETSLVGFKCKHTTPGSDALIGLDIECGHINQIEIDLKNVKVDNSDVQNKIEIAPGLVMVMKIPDFSHFSLVAESQDVSALFKFIASMVDSICDGDEVFTREDATDEEFEDFLYDLTKTQFEQLQDYFQNLPKVSIPVDFKCQKCGAEKTFNFRGIDNFFVSA